MLTRLTALTLSLILAFAPPLMAQDDTGDTAPAESEAAPADSGTEGSTDGPTLDLGEPVDETAAAGGDGVGQPYIREEFGDWALRCLRAPEGEEDPCELYQLLRDTDDNAVAEFSVVPLPAGGEVVAGATIVAPLETLLTEQIVLRVDGGESRRYPFRFCNRAGCVAQIGLTEAQVNQFKRGAAATLTMVPAAAPDQTVTLDVSLSGFTAGYDSTEAE
ncbi:invasion associated locus B family protein [Pelagovum pacificum]|uniref:Invasion associated locus B family protein n=2 Tax=Pelagovum pacificum TaxID=2588711 RepID=A0A5C5GBZ1_9RHOB|nr:invasion associated locus B family protein [Pelagovum pacificum]QQA44957.1 invasion associated locus B family protein [Pelagovum pacificum]TNY32030.1 invasion associated locus B family protein [Pelagovum pacificum]